MSNATMTVRELIREVRKPGRVYVPVVVTGDVTWLEAVKASVLHRLQRYEDREAVAPWPEVQRDEHGDLWLHNG